jgi:hypothetical protein
MRSVKSVKTPTLPELFDNNKRSQPLPQLQAFNRLTPDMTTPTRATSTCGTDGPIAVTPR